MIVTYDPILVGVSILVAIVGAYACFDSVIKIRKSTQEIDRYLLIIAAGSIGGSIWSMHFVAMQALNLDIAIRYDILITLVSGLTSILMTGLALLIVTVNVYSLGRLLLGGIVMGLGISLMHYIGMSAMRGNCVIEYNAFWVAISVLVGISASTASLWAALRLKGLARRMIAALIMGVSISGVHYIGMLGTSFTAVEVALNVSQPILSPFGLGILTAFTTFIILGGTILSLMPHTPGVESVTDVEPKDLEPKIEQASQSNSSISENHDSNTQPYSVTNSTDLQQSISPTASDTSDTEQIAADVLHKLPVQVGNQTQMIEYDEVASISADGHYTSIYTTNGDSFFCNYAISHLDKNLANDLFLRVHRSHIINLSHVEAFQRKGTKGEIFMLSGQHRIPVSRGKFSKLQELLKI